MTTDTEVEQTDRDAAADLADALGLPATAASFRKGTENANGQEWLDAFARHRLAERAAIVAWLRSCLKGYTDPWGNAADAIEQGRHHDDHSSDARNMVPDERDAEIARLRDALEEIADADQSGGPNPYEIARTALGDGR